MRPGALELFQSEMAAALLGRGPVPAVIKGQDVRFGIHRNNVIGSLVRALSVAFPATRTWLGPERFHGVATMFVHAHPPVRPQLPVFGDMFPGFLAELVANENDRLAADLASFEWARHSSYFAADAAPLSAEALATTPIESYHRLRFYMRPPVRLVTSGTDVLSLWHECQSSSHPATGKRREQRLLINRINEDVICREACYGEFVLLEELAAGRQLERAADRALELDAALDLEAILGWHLSHSTFSGFEDNDGADIKP